MLVSRSTFARDSHSPHSIGTYVSQRVISAMWQVTSVKQCIFRPFVSPKISWLCSGTVLTYRRLIFYSGSHLGPKFRSALYTVGPRLAHYNNSRLIHLQIIAKPSSSLSSSSLALKPVAWTEVWEYDEIIVNRFHREWLLCHFLHVMSFVHWAWLKPGRKSTMSWPMYYSRS